MGIVDLTSYFPLQKVETSKAYDTSKADLLGDSKYFFYQGSNCSPTMKTSCEK
jgi:hypothetical protein